MPALLFGSISTLADTSEEQRAAFNEAFREHGLDWDWERDSYRDMLTGNGGRDRIAAYAAERGESVDADAIHESKSTIFRHKLQSVAIIPRPGVSEVMAAAREAGWQIALVTTTAPENVTELLGALGTDFAPDAFDLVVDATSVDAPKPDAAAYSYALDKLGVAATDCVAVEDNVGGAHAASAAGVPCVAFPNENTVTHDFGATPVHPPPRLRRAVVGGVRAVTSVSDGRRSVPATRLETTESSFHVEAYERIDYSLHLVDGVFAPHNTHLADAYRRWGRCLAVVDAAVDQLLRRAPARLLRGTRHRADRRDDRVPRDREELGDGRTHRRRVRRVRPGAQGAGAGDRRRPDHRHHRLRLLDVPPRHELHPHPDDAHRAHRRQRGDQGRGQPRQGEEPPRRLPRVPAGAARLLLPADAARRADPQRHGRADQDLGGRQQRHLRALEKHGEDLLHTGFGHRDASPELREVADRIGYDAIRTMLELEVANLHELELDRVIAFGHTWSPTLELSADPPFFHGQAISIDMALSTTLAEERGYISDGRARPRVLADEPAGPGPRQPAGHPGAAAHGDRLDRADA